MNAQPLSFIAGNLTLTRNNPRHWTLTEHFNPYSVSTDYSTATEALVFFAQCAMRHGFGLPAGAMLMLAESLTRDANEASIICEMRTID